MFRFSTEAQVAQLGGVASTTLDILEAIEGRTAKLGEGVSNGKVQRAVRVQFQVIQNGLRVNLNALLLLALRCTVTVSSPCAQY